MPSQKPSQSDFGRRLIALRKARGLTQVQLARAASITQRAVSYYETGAGFPPAPVVAALAQALAISTDELLGLQPRRRELARFEQLAADPDTRRLWKQFQRMAALPDRDQRAVLRLISSLAGKAS